MTGVFENTLMGRGRLNSKSAWLTGTCVICDESVTLGGASKTTTPGKDERSRVP